MWVRIGLDYFDHLNCPEVVVLTVGGKAFPALRRFFPSAIKDSRKIDISEMKDYKLIPHLKVYKRAFNTVRAGLVAITRRDERVAHNNINAQRSVLCVLQALTTPSH